MNIYQSSSYLKESTKLFLTKTNFCFLSWFVEPLAFHSNPKSQNLSLKLTTWVCFFLVWFCCSLDFAGYISVSVLISAFLIWPRYLNSFLYNLFICLGNWFLFVYLMLIFFPVILFWPCHPFFAYLYCSLLCFVASSMKYLLFLSKFCSIYSQLIIISHLKSHILMPLCQPSFLSFIFKHCISENLGAYCVFMARFW